jgi:hypothetical protein
MHVATQRDAALSVPLGLFAACGRAALATASIADLDYDPVAKVIQLWRIMG